MTFLAGDMLQKMRDSGDEAQERFASAYSRKFLLPDRDIPVTRLLDEFTDYKATGRFYWEDSVKPGA